MNEANERGGGRILVVDDEPSIVDAVATALRYEGFDVDEAADRPRRARRGRGLRARPVVLDWMLPDLDGIEVGRRLREQGFKTAILFLTAKDAVENKVEALRAGGDDYVTKPFSLAEVVARVQAILRRTAGDAAGRRARASPTCASTRRDTRCSAARRAIDADRDRVLAAPLLPAQPAPRAVEGADPPERLAVRLRRQLERRRDVRELPAQEARRARAAADPDGAAGRATCSSTERVACSRGSSLRARLLLGVIALAARRSRRCGRRDVRVAALVPDRPDRHARSTSRMCSRAVDRATANFGDRGGFGPGGGPGRRVHPAAKPRRDGRSHRCERPVAGGTTMPSPPKLPATISLPAVAPAAAIASRYFTVVGGEGRRPLPRARVDRAGLSRTRSSSSRPRCATWTAPCIGCS